MSENEQRRKADDFRALHLGQAPLVLPNVWDSGSAVIAAEAGFPALATTSAGVAWALGQADGEQISRDEMLAAVAGIATRVSLPVTADMEAGYGITPDEVAETVRLTIAAGAIGINLEDGVDHAAGTLLERSAAVERIVAARAVAEETGVPLVINARTDVYFDSAASENERLDEAAGRANAYLDAGADCAFVIAVDTAEEIGNLVREIDGPLNVIAGAGGLDINGLASLGVKRISLAGGLARSVLGHLRIALAEIRDSGTLGFLDCNIPHGEVNRLYEK